MAGFCVCARAKVLVTSFPRKEQDELSDEVRESLRRRGIRFRPYA